MSNRFLEKAIKKFGYENISKEELQKEIIRYKSLGKDNPTIEFITKYLLANGLNQKPWTFENSEYVRCESKIKFICKKHGELEGTPKLILRPHSHKGCKQCGLENRKSPNKADYKKRTISDSRKELRKILKEYGYENIDRDLLKEQIRYYIGLGKDVLTILFLTKNFLKNGLNKNYSFEKTNYTGSNKKVTVTCDKHGDFDILAMNVLVGKRCLKCSNGEQRISYDCRIKEAKLIYGDRFEYDHEYNRENYVHVRDGFKLKMKCEVHGWVFQSMAQHLNNGGCKQCARDNTRINYNDYIIRAKIIHNNKYKYDDEYNRKYFIHVNDNFKLKIICPIHGVYFQRMTVHVHGNCSGCPLCNDSKNERELYTFFIERGLVFNKDFFREKSFDDLLSAKGYPLRYDFWIPSKNLLIELDGRQHFEFIVGMHKDENAFNTQLSNDKLKNEYAKNNNLNLLRIKFDEFANWLSNLNLSKIIKSQPNN